MSSSNCSNDYFKRWLEENFVPSGIVFSTKSAREIIGKNNLTPSQFLRPFGVINDYVVNIKDYQNKINSFRFDFFDSTDYHKNQKKISNYLNNCISCEKNIPKFSIDSIHLNKNNYSSFFENTKYYSKNYYNECEKIILEYCYFDENEIYQQPLLFVYFIDITNNIDDIKNMKNNFPNLVKDIYDTEMIELIIILNDKSEEKEKNIDKINILKKEIKSNLLVFEINNNKTPNNNNFDFFYEYFHRLEVYNGDFNKNILGQLISKDEINKIKSDFHFFLRNQFLLQLNKKILDLKQKDPILQIFPKSSIVQCEYFKLSYKFIGYQKAKLILGIILFYLRAYKESYICIKKLYKYINEQQPKKNEISLFQFKSIIKIIIEEKNINNNFDLISLYKKNIQLFNNSDQKTCVEIIRAVFINIRIFEKYLNEYFIIYLLNKYKEDLQKFEYNFIYGLILEKLAYYYLYKEKPQIRTFTKYLIRWCPSYWNISSENNKKIKYKYLLYILGLFCDIFHMKENYNESLKFSFFFIKKYITKYLIISCYNIGFNEGINFFYLVLLKLYKIPVNLNLNEKEIDEKQEEYLELSAEMSKFINNKMHFIDNSDIINFDKSSILIITKREEDILDKKFKTNFLYKFKKYFTPKLNEVYCILTQNDLSSFKYIDKISNNEDTFNYYIKKDIEVNLNEIIRIKFTFSNPFPFNDKYESIKFIFDNNNLVECEEKSLTMKGLSKVSLELSVKFIGKGKVSIIGISYIRANVHEINNIFDYKIKTFLYSQLHDEDKEYNFEKKKRKKKFSEYNFLNNKDKRKNYTFDILDYDSNINISIANNESVLTIYQYEVYFFPIKILNNSKYEIRKFSIFFEAEEKEKILLPPYFYNDENNLRKEFIIYIPIICLEFGKNFLYIVFKFEEKNNDIDSKKFILELNVIKSYNIGIIDNYISKKNDIIKREICIKCSTFDNQEINADLFKENNDIILPNNFKIEKDKIYFIKNSFFKEIEIHSENMNGKIKENQLYENINFKEDYNNDLINQFFKSFQNNNLLFKCKINDKNLLYIHEINNNNFKQYQEYSYKHLIEQNLNITYNIKDLNDDEKYMTVYVNFDIKTFITYTENHLKKIIIGIDNEIESIFEWLGLQYIIISNFEKNTINKTFNCIIKSNLNKNFEREIEGELNKIYIAIEIENTNKIYKNLYNPYLFKN